MDNTEIFIKDTEPDDKPTEAEEVNPIKQRKKQRAPMTEDRKAILLNNLRKGREKYKQKALEKKKN